MFCFSGHRALEFLHLQDGGIDYKEVSWGSSSRGLSCPSQRSWQTCKQCLSEPLFFFVNREYFGVKGARPLQRYLNSLRRSLK